MRGTGRKITSKQYSYSQALEQTLKEAGVDKDSFAKLIDDSGHMATRYRPIIRDGKPSEEMLNRLIEPVSVRLSEISERLHFKTQTMFRNIQNDSAVYEKLAHPFTHRWGSTAIKGKWRDLKTALVIGDESMFKSAMAKMPAKFQKSYPDYKKAMDELYDMMAKVRKGTKLPMAKKLDVYMHRSIKDVGAVRKWMEKEWGPEHLSRIDKIIKDQFEHGATDEQLAKVYMDYLIGFYDKKGLKTTPTASKGRRLKKEDFEKYPELIDLALKLLLSAMTAIAVMKNRICVLISSSY